MTRTCFSLALAGVLLAALPAAARQAPVPLTLDEAVRVYLERNLELEAARLEVERARAEQIGARLRPNPSITFNAENLRLGGPLERLHEISLSYAETIELGGKRRRRTEVADLSVALAEAALEDARRRGVAQVKRLHYEAVLARAYVERAAARRDDLERLAAYNQARFEEGAVAELDLLQARIEQVRAAALFREAELDLQQKTIRLVEYIGESDFRGRVVAGALAFEVATLDLETLTAAALADRPDLRRARLAGAQAAARIELARAQGAPDVTPFVGYKRVASSDTLLAGFSLPLPFRHRNQDGVARAISEQRIAEAAAGAAENRVRAEVAAAYAAYAAARDQAAALQEDLLQQAEQARRITLAAYEEGATELLPLLEAQRVEAEVRRLYDRALFDYQASRIDLELAVGRELQP